MSYVGNNKSYVEDGNSYVGDSNSYVRNIKSYVGDNKFYVLVSPTKEIMSYIGVGHNKFYLGDN